jgi:hypothetical protein
LLICVPCPAGGALIGALVWEPAPAGCFFRWCGVVPVVDVVWEDAEDEVVVGGGATDVVAVAEAVAVLTLEIAMMGSRLMQQRARQALKIRRQPTFWASNR